MPALWKGKKKIMAKRIRASRFDFNLPEKQYTTQALENYVHMATRDDMLALRAEYTRMRDTAQKRIKRIQEAGFGFSKYIQERPEGFPKLKDIDERDLPQAMNELYRFLSAKTSTLAGQRETMRKTIETFEKSGVTITPKEYPRFIEVLEKLRKSKIKQMYDSKDLKAVTDASLAITKDENNKASKLFVSNASRLKKLLDHANELDKLTNAINNHKGKFTAVNMDKYIKSFGW